MQNVKENIKHLFAYFFSPKEILIVFFLLFLSVFFFLAFLHKGSTYLMTERVVYSGSAVEGVIGSPSETNPYKSDTQIDKDLHKLLYSSLIKNLSITNADNKFDLGLAKSVEVSSDKNVYKITLRDSIVFSNGTNITPEDVIYSLNKVPMEKNYSVEKTSDRVLTFKIKHNGDKVDNNSSLNFLESLTYPIVPNNTTFENNFSTNMVTSSFFKIKSIGKDSDGNITAVYLERFNNGENKLPYLENFTIKYFKDEVLAYEAFQRKEIDLLSGLPGTSLSKITDDTNIILEVTPLPNNFAVFINQNKNESLRNNKLRQAMSDVIDRGSLTNQVLGSFGIPEKNLLGESGKPTNAQEIIENLTSGSSPSFSYQDGVLYTGTKKTQNTNSAKSGDNSSNQNTNQKDQREVVKIKITTIRNTELEETAKFLQTTWKKIGVETEIEVIDRKDLSTVVKDRDFETLLFGFSIKSPRDYYSFFSSKERNYPKLNISNYTSKQVDKILDVLADETEKSRIDDLVRQLSVEIAEDNPVIILYKPQFVFAHFLALQIKLPNTIKSEDERYAYVEYWYTNTEKVLSIFKDLKIIDKLDTLLY